MNPIIKLKNYILNKLGFVKNNFRPDQIYNIIYRPTTDEESVELLELPLVQEAEDSWITENEFIRQVLIESNEVKELI